MNGFMTLTNLLFFNLQCQWEDQNSYSILLYLVKLAGMLSQYEAHNLKHNHFFSGHGFIGGNIPLV